jgi:hypothetical protein
MTSSPIYLDALHRNLILSKGVASDADEIVEIRLLGFLGQAVLRDAARSPGGVPR